MKIYKNGSRYSVELYGNYLPITIDKIEEIWKILSSKEVKEEFKYRFDQYLIFGIKVQNPIIIWNEIQL